MSRVRRLVEQTVFSVDKKRCRAFIVQQGDGKYDIMVVGRTYGGSSYYYRKDLTALGFKFDWELKMWCLQGVDFSRAYHTIQKLTQLGIAISTKSKTVYSRIVRQYTDEANKAKQNKAATEEQERLEKATEGKTIDSIEQELAKAYAELEEISDDNYYAGMECHRRIDALEEQLKFLQAKA